MDVTAPNADTLYSAAFLDVSKEPIILTYPDMHGQYFVFPIYSRSTNVLSKIQRASVRYSSIHDCKS
jgi:hypothetical protein